MCNLGREVSRLHKFQKKIAPVKINMVDQKCVLCKRENRSRLLLLYLITNPCSVNVRASAVFIQTLPFAANKLSPFNASQNRCYCNVTPNISLIQHVPPATKKNSYTTFPLIIK